MQINKLRAAKGNTHTNVSDADKGRLEFAARVVCLAQSKWLEGVNNIREMKNEEECDNKGRQKSWTV